MRKYLHYAKWLIIFVIAIDILANLLGIIAALSGDVPSQAFISITNWFPYIVGITPLAFDLAVLFIILFLLKKKA